MNLVQSLVQQLEESYHMHAWHGTSLRGSIRGLSLDQLCWRPSPQRHNIWEEVIHCAYWKYTVRRRLTRSVLRTGEKRGSFPLKGSNWFKRPVEKSEEAWKADVHLLDEMHFHLVEAVKSLSEKDLMRKTAVKKYTHLQTIQGIAMHDVYHAGQIQLLKRLQK